MKPKDKPVFDYAFDFQHFRQTVFARLIRRLSYRFFIGKSGYPLTFRSPQIADHVPRLSSPNIYIHLPFCATICAHCTYNKRKYHSPLVSGYHDALLRELDAYLQGEEIQNVKSLYFGGGTPALMPATVESVIEKFAAYLDDDAEIAIEMHPRDVNPATLSRFHDAGINKISIGIESFNENSLELLRRHYSATTAVSAIQTAHTFNFACLDVNLIYGIPGQAVSDALNDVERCIALDVDQISAYPLFSFPKTPLGKQIEQNRLKSYGVRARVQTQRGIAVLCRDAGYNRSSIWSFTKNSVAPYTTVTRDCYRGFGAGAASKIDNSFWFNTFSVEGYVSSIPLRPALELNASQEFRRFHWLYWQIYKTRIDPAEYHALYKRDFYEDFSKVIRLLKLFGWAHEQADRTWKLTDRGADATHRLQSLFSLSYIDTLWEKCQHSPWPDKIVLR